MDKKLKNLNEKELETIEILKKINKNDNMSTKCFIDNFIRIKNTKDLGNVIYCIQVPDPKFRDMCSVVAYLLDQENRQTQAGKITFGVKNYNRKEVSIDRIYVAPEFNHKGIGSSLVEVFEEACTTGFGDRVKVSGVILPDNDDDKSLLGVCRFYKKNGYDIEVANKTTLTLNKTLKKKFSLFKPNNSLIDFKEKI